MEEPLPPPPGIVYNSTMEMPRLRPLDAIPVADGRVALRDPDGFSEKMLIVSNDVAYLCFLLDGKRTMVDIQASYTKAFGEILMSSRVDKILRQLDDCLFLRNPRFEAEKRRIIEAFKKDTLRRSLHLEGVFGKDPASIREQLEALLPPGPEIPVDRKDPKALIAPHIDIKRGGTCYSQSYRVLANLSDVDVWVILGISHVETSRKFVLTGKDFETPFGTAVTDKDLLERLKEKLEYDFLSDEFVHKNEHSVEFQVFLLQYMLGNHRPLSILPILCSGFPYKGAGVEERDHFISSLSSVLKESGKRYFIIAGADLSHLGLRFGRQVELSREFYSWAETEDRRMLDHVLSGDAEGFLGFIEAEGDRRNICGVPAIYTLLRCVEFDQAELVSYHQAVEEEAQSVVTFAGIAFY